VNFVVECYCAVQDVRRISADFAARGEIAGEIEREPLSNQSLDKLIFALLSVLVSNGARGLGCA
jgi:hypothetical protein